MGEVIGLRSDAQAARAEAAALGDGQHDPLEPSSAQTVTISIGVDFPLLAAVAGGRSWRRVAPVGGVARCARQAPGRLLFEPGLRTVRDQGECASSRQIGLLDLGVLGPFGSARGARSLV